MLLIAGLLGMAAVGSVVMIGTIGDDDDDPGGRTTAPELTEDDLRTIRYGRGFARITSGGDGRGCQRTWHTGVRCQACAGRQGWCLCA